LRETDAVRWPQIKLVAEMGGEQFGQELGHHNFNTRAQLQLQVPLFQGFSLENQVREARANLEASRAALELQEEAVISDVWTAFYGFQSAGAQLEAAETGLASATASFEGSLERYRNGAADIVELIQAQSTLAASRAQLVEARTAVFNAYAQLGYATGEQPTVP